MTSDFIATFKPVLILGKTFGLIDVSYTFDTTGLLILKKSSYHSCLELIRTLVLVVATFIVYNAKGMYYIQRFRLVKFWVVIIASRLSQVWIVK